jgi:hypothetical protein
MTKKQEAVYADLQIILIALSLLSLLIAFLSVSASMEPGRGFESAFLSLFAVPGSLLVGAVGLGLTNKQARLSRDQQTKAAPHIKWFKLYYVIVMAMPFIFTYIIQI